MKLCRFIKKTIYHLSIIPIRFINYYDPRLCMKFYNKLLSFSGVVLNGQPRFISTDIKIDTFELIELGNRVVISKNVILLTHDYSCTTAFIAINENPKTDVSINGKIKIGNNVFIGMGCIILPNTTINDNVIIGAGSVVRGSIPDNSVYLGNPGNVVMSINDYAFKVKSKFKSSNVYFDKK